MKKVLFILGQLTDLDVEWIAGSGVKRRLAPGTVLIHEGRPVAFLYIVIDGEVEVSKAGSTATVRVGSGEIIGEMSFVDASPPSATVKALADAVVLEIPRDRLAAKLAQDTAFAARFYLAVAMLLSDRLRSYSWAGTPASGGLEEDDLDANVLDAVSLAGDRFGRLLQKLGTARATS